MSAWPPVVTLVHGDGKINGKCVRAGVRSDPRPNERRRVGTRGQSERWGRGIVRAPPGDGEMTRWTWRSQVQEGLHLPHRPQRQPHPAGPLYHRPQPNLSPGEQGLARAAEAGGAYSAAEGPPFDHSPLVADRSVFAGTTQAVGCTGVVPKRSDLIAPSRASRAGAELRRATDRDIAPANMVWSCPASASGSARPEDLSSSARYDLTSDR